MRGTLSVLTSHPSGPPATAGGSDRGGVAAVLRVRRGAAAEEFGGEERDGQFMMSGDGEAATCAAAGRAADDVGERAVGLYEVEVGRREVFQRVAEVADERDALEEDLGQDHGRADVEVDAAAAHSTHKLREQAEVRVRRRAQGRAVGLRVAVRDVRPDGDVRGEGDASAVGRAEQRKLRVPQLRLDEQPPESLT